MTKLDRWLLPYGIEDVLPNKATDIEAKKHSTLDLSINWKYSSVEYTDALLKKTVQNHHYVHSTSIIYRCFYANTRPSADSKSLINLSYADFKPYKATHWMSYHPVSNLH